MSPICAYCLQTSVISLAQCPLQIPGAGLQGVCKEDCLLTASMKVKVTEVTYEMECLLSSNILILTT